MFVKSSLDEEGGPEQKGDQTFVRTVIQNYVKNYVLHKARSRPSATFQSNHPPLGEMRHEPIGGAGVCCSRSCSRSSCRGQNSTVTDCYTQKRVG